ncbi:polyadenylate-binding protein-interacting protein 6-like [Andrographis paniculata]|uniref:polyadenylate-binding protein-interacting protein 6-like n=1 Tax=Andrographis paniculata TaxID=175694 RepID=UPI0021E890DD|nr:polyadenylate-binding protein-interacting protein 6-like [Andrographis paniculata]
MTQNNYISHENRPTLPFPDPSKSDRLQTFDSLRSFSPPAADHEFAHARELLPPAAYRVCDRAMKTGTSSLNPYAASYIPLFKRVAAAAEADNPAKDSNSRGKEVVRLTHERRAIATQTYNLMKQKEDHRGFTWTSPPSNLNEDADISYLRMNFPGISNESLHGVYFASNCNLDAAVDMLNQLENVAEDSLDILPDTLDIGDVPESSKEAKKEAAVGGLK